MANYCVTFRISNNTVDGATYQDRYDRLMSNIRTKGLGYWEATTSFILVESDLNTAEFGQKACRGLIPSEDMLFIFDPEDMSAVYFGAVEEVDVLASFFPRLRKVN